MTPAPGQEEAAAIAAVLEVLLAGQQAQAVPPVSRWKLAGRLEAHGLPTTSGHFRSGWRS